MTTAVRRPARVRTYHPRRGRLSGRHLDALDRLLPAYGVQVAEPPGAPLDVAALFDRRAPLVVEIGSGMGEATVEMAAADPGRNYLAVEVYLPGIANLLAAVEERGLANVRVARGDALDLLRHQLPPACAHAVHVFFPDPWPKARHGKRRLVQPRHVDLLCSRLLPGGTLHCATDDAAYAESTLATLAAHPDLRNAYESYAPRPAARPQTKYERQALDSARPVWDLIFRRRP